MLDLAGSDHDEAPPQTPAARSFTQAAAPWTGHKGVPQEWGTIETSRPRRTRHTSRVASLAGRSAVFAGIWGLVRQFAMRGHVPQKVTRKVEVLAKLPWLAFKHDEEKGGAWVG